MGLSDHTLQSMHRCGVGGLQGSGPRSQSLPKDSNRATSSSSLYLPELRWVREVPEGQAVPGIPAEESSQCRGLGMKRKRQGQREDAVNNRVMG